MLWKFIIKFTGNHQSRLKNPSSRSQPLFWCRSRAKTLLMKLWHRLTDWTNRLTDGSYRSYNSNTGHNMVIHDLQYGFSWLQLQTSPQPSLTTTKMVFSKIKQIPWKILKRCERLENYFTFLHVSLSNAFLRSKLRRQYFEWVWAQRIVSRAKFF